MELLTNIMNNNKVSVEYDAENFQVLKVGDVKGIQEKDKIFFLPYLINSNDILMKYDELKILNIVRPEINKYVHVPFVELNSNNFEEYIRKAMIDQFGIELNSEYKIQIYSPIFNSLNNTSRTYICILQLMEYDYNYIDVNNLPKNNTKISVNELKNIIIYDLTSLFVLEIFKKNYAINF